MNSLSLKLVVLFHLGAVLPLPAAPAASIDTMGAARELDALLAKDWAKEKIEPNPPASDEVIVRRLYLDLAGRIPTYRETEEFLASTGANKRGELIDTLLASDGYAQHFFNYWADVLRLQSFGQIGTV